MTEEKGKHHPCPCAKCMPYWPRATVEVAETRATDLRLALVEQERLRSELSTLRQQLEAERHGVWAAGHRAGWKDRFGSDCAFDQGYDPDEPTPNPYPPPPAEAPALPVGKETE